MPPRCCVPMCTTCGGHRFPRDPFRKREWLKAICRDSLTSTDSIRVCKEHFIPEDYIQDPYTKERTPFLKKHAVPSKFVWTSSKIFEDKKQYWRQVKLVGPKRRSRLREEKKDRNTNINSVNNHKTAVKKRKIPQKDSNLNHKMSTDEEGVALGVNKKQKKHDEQAEISRGQQSEKDTESMKTEDKSDENCEETSECRACLQQERADRLYNLFQGWEPMWESLGTTIAEDLNKLADVQLSETDLHSKFICYACCTKLWDACHFKMLVQDNDRILKDRIADDQDKVWPKPIQVDKSMNGVYENSLPFNVDIKQEVLSDEEASNMEEVYSEANLMEIKVEPEEIVEPPPILVNGVTSLKEFPVEDTEPQLLNGEPKTDEETAVKEEPVSDNEESGVPLECMLCMRSFNSVTGLKAHVIAQHSYQTVGRDDSPHRKNNGKHVCATCRRTFTTSTDLMVHETCHNKHVCYGCSANFDTFNKLSAHRKRCKALASTDLKRPKTLDDVIRPTVKDAQNKEGKSRELSDVTNTTDMEDTSKLFSCPLCNEIFSDSYYVKIHQEIHHSNDTKVPVESTPMEIEMLESIFSEET